MGGKKCLAYTIYKKARVPILISDKVDFKTELKKIFHNNGLIHQEDKTIVNLYVHNNKNDGNKRRNREIYEHAVAP